MVFGNEIFLSPILLLFYTFCFYYVQVSTKFTRPIAKEDIKWKKGDIKVPISYLYIIYPQKINFKVASILHMKATVKYV